MIILQIALIVAFLLLLINILMPYMEHWGATREEVRMRLPGDGMLPPPFNVSTRAITINAPAESIWPWIVQIGQRRGGFYSYDFLENLFGLDIHSADRIHDEWQNLRRGDMVSFSKKGGELVYRIEPEHYLLLAGNTATMKGEPTPVGELEPKTTWLFYLEPTEEGTTRLITRAASTMPKNPVLDFLLGSVFSPVVFIMEQRMLRGIKNRAEKYYRNRLVSH